MSAFFIQACQDAGIELSNYILAEGMVYQVKKNRESQGNKIMPQPNKLNPNELLISKILDKYPDFDPNWSLMYRNHGWKA